MKTIILPGFSHKNKDWADSIANELQNHIPTTVHGWNHWISGKPENNWIEKEAARIVKEIGSNKVNLLAKSIGTAVAMVVLKLKTELINKVILCGIPVNDFLEGDEKYYDALKSFPSNRLLCIQNKDDNHGSLSQVEKLLRSINPAIKIVSKSRTDHEYPYIEDFEKFLV